MTQFEKAIRLLGSPVKRWLFPSPEVRAWRRACREAERVPRYRAGTIRLMDYELEYADLLSTCPQWYDLFVDRSLRFCSARPGPYVIDCGANIGLSVMATRRDHPGAQIVAFEADPTICGMLGRNLDRNAIADVDVRNAAVWVDGGVVSFRCEGADSGAVDSVAGSTAGEVRSVPAVRLKDLLVDQPVDLLKVDIEGAELDVLRDCGDALENVRALALDLHELDPANRRTSEVLQILDHAGFTYHQDALHPLPWRDPSPGGGSTFPEAHLCWVSLIRAWRPEG